MLTELKADIELRMDKSAQSFQAELKSIRTGRATPSLLEHIMVEAYESFAPLNQVGSVSAQDAKLLLVQVWDKRMVKSVEKAINNANLGVCAFSEGQTIRVPIPPLSEERRKDLVKVIGKYAEQARIAIRSIRRDGMDKVKKAEQDGAISKDAAHKANDEIQKMTDAHVQKIDEMTKVREKEIMQI